MSKRKEDRLEEFFRDHLEHFEEDPGMELFAGIAANIPSKPKRRRAWLLPLSFGFLLLAVGFGWYQYQNVQGLYRQVDDQNEKIEGLQKQLKAIENTRKFNTPVSPEKTIPAGDDVPVQAFNASKVPSTPMKTFANNSSTSQQRRGTIIPGNQRIGSGQLLEKLQESNLDLDKEGIAAEGQQIGQGNASDRNLLLSAAPLDFLNGADASLLESRFGEDEIDPLNGPRPNQTGWYYGLYHEFLSNSFEELNGPVLTERGLRNHSQRFGILVGRHLNKNWSLQVGAGVNNLLLRYEGMADLNYQFAEPDAHGIASASYSLNENGDPIFDFLQYEMILENQLQNDGNDLEDGEPFVVNVARGLHRLNYANIPLWLAYTTAKGRIHFTAKAGLVYNHLLNDKPGGRHIIRVEGDRAAFDRLKYVNHTTEVVGEQDSYLEVGMSLGGSYDISPRLQLALLSTFYRTLNPVFINNTNELGLHTNLYYKF